MFAEKQTRRTRHDGAHLTEVSARSTNDGDGKGKNRPPTHRSETMKLDPARLVETAEGEARKKGEKGGEKGKEAARSLEAAMLRLRFGGLEESGRRGVVLLESRSFRRC